MASDIATSNREGGAQALAKSARTSAPDDRSFAILRYAKLKTTSAIRGSSAHMRRTMRTPNADASRTNANQVFTGSEDPTADVLSRLPELGARNEDGHLLRRANSVCAVEVMMTTSPEWWRDASQADADAWVERSRAWLAEEWGADNVVHLEAHRDETTLHLTGFVVPLDPDTGALNARRWIGGRSSRAEPGTSRLSGHQTRYAEAVEDLGLRRGRIGSTATHVELREYQRRASVVLNEEVQPPQIGTPPLTGREKWAEEAQAKVDAAIAAQSVGAAEARTERESARAAGDLADRRQDALETARAERRAATDRLREIPVEQVVQDLGAEWDAQEKRWKLGPDGARTHKLEVDTDRNRWRCAITQTGGRGAIDAVKAIMETDFNGALSWLADRYGERATAADGAAAAERQTRDTVQRAHRTRPPFTPPTPD
ncbi:MobV family relaxase, partial [Roseovarius sp. SYSU LYC5161]|uniref:MobV family relaxase n=1 Tax=Roseovarius halophilus (ex Wu et al. 2025) TaxID=3376060 RepID=UPI00399BC949